MVKQVYDEAKYTNPRLPYGFSPVKYDLELKPNFDNFTFEGKVSIHYNTLKDAELEQIMCINARELVIKDGSLGPVDRGNANPQNVSQLVMVVYSKNSGVATLTFDKQCPPTGRVNLNFTGIMDDKLRGFYRSAFKVGNSTVHAGFTQFAATDARLCFPCFDEPAFKASFKLTLVIDRFMMINGQKYERVALSNTLEESRSGPDTETAITFQETPIMSSYLLAFAIGPFEFVEASEKQRPIRVYTTPGKKEHGRFALEVACKCLAYYEDYFGIKYPLPKMDLIAVTDLSYGAMENWGLITYRENRLLCDPANTATDRKQDIALVVAHEISHQWFGNLVTMKWWTHLWLNEGFASFMEVQCVNNIFPEYDIWSQFLVDKYSVALTLDALHSSHPIEIQVKSPAEIDEIFDAISYCKGASVIRMLHEFIGDENFRNGMTSYLTKFAYSNAATEDLWDSLEAASEKPVRQMMSGWTSQMGFPWLSLESSQTADGKTKLVLTQNKFTADGELASDEKETLWMVPVRATFGASPDERREICLLDRRSREFVCKEDSWIKFNSGCVGLYRTAYPADMMNKLHPVISSKSLPVADRFNIQSDYFALCRAGAVSTVDFLKLLQVYKNEDDFTVLASIDMALGKLGSLMAGTDYCDKFHALGRSLLSDLLKRLTWKAQEGESHTQAMTRALVLNRLVQFGDQTVIDQAKRQFDAHVAKSSTIAADLRDAVYKAIAIYGDDASFEHLFNIYKTHDLQEEKERAAVALGHSTSGARIERVVALSLSKEARDQDRLSIFMSIGQANPTVAWKLLQDNKDFIRGRYETGILISRAVKCLTQNLKSELAVHEMISFFEQNKFPGADRAVLQSVENVKLNAQWMARDGDLIREYLATI